MVEPGFKPKCVWSRIHVLNDHSTQSPQKWTHISISSALTEKPEEGVQYCWSSGILLNPAPNQDNQITYIFGQSKCPHQLKTRKCSFNIDIYFSISLVIPFLLSPLDLRIHSCQLSAFSQLLLTIDSYSIYLLRREFILPFK